jgi:hypothetical protein
VAVENNKFDTIRRLKKIYKNLYFTQDKVTRGGPTPPVRTHGWNTIGMTKSTKLFYLRRRLRTAA